MSQSSSKWQRSPTKMSDTFDSQSGLVSPILLRKIDELRENNIGKHIPLPQLVVVGDQSSGKSSLLENLTGIPFPRDVELCTRYATQITSRRDSESRIVITIIAGPHATDAHKKKLEDFRLTMLSSAELRRGFPEILKSVNTTMGIRTDISSSEGTVFSQDVLKIEICGPEEDYLTVIDVPGIFRTPTEGVTTMNDINLVRNMVEGYIKDSRTIILAVLASNIDIANQEILTLAEKYDKKGERTLGILTKPDLVTEQTAKNAVCNIVLGKKKQLTLGYYIIRNRGADESDSDLEYREQIFREAPWNNLPKDRVGIRALKKRLAELLGQIARQEFPALRKEIKEMLQTTREEIHNLGQSRLGETEQRIFLSGIARQFQSLVRASLDPNYAAHSVFDDKPELRLITHISYLNDVFNEEFQRKALLRHFNTNLSEDCKEHILTAGLSKDMRVVQNIETLDFPELDNIISCYTEVDDPVFGIEDWIQDLYLRSRGADLAPYSGSVLSSAFKEQSSKWEAITRSYLSKVVMTIHRFITSVLSILCSDPRVREELLNAILDGVVEKYEAGMNQALFLISVERERKPYTLNRYFNQNLQASAGDRIVGLLGGQVKKEENGPSLEMVVTFESIRHATEAQSNIKHITGQIHDTLKAYYDIAAKRFVDNVYNQAVDHCLLTGPSSPLAVFNQDWVIRLNAEQLEAIAGETEAVKERRNNLAKSIQGLTRAMQILKS